MKSNFQSKLKLGHVLIFPKPQMFDKIWGGKKLTEVLGKEGDSNTKWGEVWELSDVSGSPSKIEISENETDNLHSIFLKNKKEVLGAKCPYEGDVFPLLYKFIDASDKLSVQVHPGENNLLGDSKTEAWFVLDAPAGASIIVGIEGEGSKKKLFQKLKTSEASDVLAKIPVKPGDTLFIPPGTVHAITEGLLIYEIQQNSDTTFRIYDWDRTDDSGKPRKLHLKEAEQVVDFRTGGQYKIEPLVEEKAECQKATLVACSNFVLEKWSQFKRTVDLQASHGGFQVLSNIGSACTLSVENESWTLEKGQTVLIPATVKTTQLQPSSQDTVILRSWMPHKYPNDLLSSLLPAGFSQKEILSLGSVF